MKLRSERGRAPWIAIVAATVLVAGVGIAAWQSRALRLPTSQERRTPPAAVGDTGGDVVERALAQIPPDSAALKSRWIDEVQGVDASALSAERHEIFVRFANAERCTCGCGYTLAACRVYDTTCPVSLPRIESLLDSVRSGQITSAAGLRERRAWRGSGSMMGR